MNNLSSEYWDCMDTCFVNCACYYPAAGEIELEPVQESTDYGLIVLAITAPFDIIYIFGI